jgi:hypothetical protein
MSYDPKCQELAEHFLPSGTSRLTVEHLAQVIQDAVEDEINSMSLEITDKLTGAKFII